MSVGNEYEARGRLEKARKLAAVLARVLDQNPSLTVEDVVQRSTAETRRLTAEAAGVRLPSDETWDWTIELLRDLRRGT